MQAYRKRLWAEIDLDAVRENYLAVRAAVKPAARICCVVKADAYGHGAVALSRYFESLGADLFAVSNITEAMQLRRGGVRGDILILGYVPAECAAILAENDLTQTVFSMEYAEALQAAAESAGVRVRVHIKVDTGMGRIGLVGSEEEVCEDIGKIVNMLNLSAEGIFTHLAQADRTACGERYTVWQAERFLSLLSVLRERGIGFELAHCANSAALMWYEPYHMDAVRAGIVLYGGISDEALPIRPVLSLRTVISQVKDLKKGDCVGYGSVFCAPQDMRIATVPVGYADGYFRSNAEGGYMLLHGKKAPIVGRICMDQLMLDVSDIPSAAMNDAVTVIGRDGDACITAEEIAQRTHTIPYEVLCAVSKRVPRVYLESGRVVYVKDDIMGDET